MATLDNYNGSVKVLSGLTPVGDYPLMEAHDIVVDEDGTRLDERFSFGIRRTGEYYATNLGDSLPPTIKADAFYEVVFLVLYELVSVGIICAKNGVLTPLVSSPGSKYSARVRFDPVTGNTALLRPILEFYKDGVADSGDGTQSAYLYPVSL